MKVVWNLTGYNDRGEQVAVALCATKKQALDWLRFRMAVTEKIVIERKFTE